MLKESTNNNVAVPDLLLSLYLWIRCIESILSERIHFVVAKKRNQRDEMSHNILSSRILSILLVVHVITVRVKSNSAGTGYACVDAMDLCKMPCPDDGEDRPWATKSANGVTYPCCPIGMDLVKPPTKSNNYLVTTSSKDGTYNPCEVMTVTVKTLTEDGKYLGLLLYAVEDSGDKTFKTGQWILPKSDNPKFWTPPVCQGKAVMHPL